MAQQITPTCEWFALCANDAEGAVMHPILGPVPTCRRCADKMDQTLIPATFEVAP